MGRALLIRSGGLGDMVLTVPVARALGEERAVSWLTARRYAAWVTALGLGGVVGLLEDARAALLFAAGAEEERAQAWRDELRGMDRAVSFLGEPGGNLAANLRGLGVGDVLEIGAARDCEAADAAGRQFLGQVAAGAEFEGAWRCRGLAVSDTLAGEGMMAWARLGLRPKEGLVIHPGSGGMRKNLPPASLVRAAVQLAAGVGLSPVVLLGPAEEGGAAAAAAGAWGLPVARGLGLCELTGFLRGAAGVITHDSGVGHLAAAVGTRVVAVFGPTDPRMWAPPFTSVAIVWCADAGVGAAGGGGALAHVGWWGVYPACGWADAISADVLEGAMVDGWQSVSRVCVDCSD